MFGLLAKKFDVTVDDLLASSLTKLAWLVMVAVGLWFLLREKLSARFWLGYGAGAVALFVWFSRNSKGDKVYAGSLNDYAAESAGNPSSVKSTDAYERAMANGWQP